MSHMNTSRPTHKHKHKHKHKHRGIIAFTLATLLLAAMAGFAPQHARATSYPCTLAGLNAAITAGGSATFGCSVPTVITTSEQTFTQNTTLDGGGLLTVSGGNLSRVFTVNTGVTVSLVNLTIANGSAANSGGGIANHGTLTVTNCTITGNTGNNNGNGGGIASYGALTVVGSTITGNTAAPASGWGGGIYVSSGVATVVNSTISGNSAPTSSGFGGGIYVYLGAVALVNSTITGNSGGGDGGGIRNSSSSSGALTVIYSTISGNTAGSNGGGVLSGGPLNMTDTLVVNNTAGTSGNDTFGTLATNSHNLTGAFVFASANPANNGGTIATLALPFVSPAIDTGICAPTYIDPVTNTVVTVNNDQRGVARPQGAGCDIGAYERRDSALTSTTGNRQIATVGTAFAVPLAVTVGNATAGDSVSGLSVTFIAPASGPSGIFVGGANNGLGAVATTDANGLAVAPAFTANSVAGNYTVTAFVSGASGVAPVRFDLANLPGAAASIVVADGNNQSATLGTALPTPLSARVFDAEGNPAPNVNVIFSYLNSNGGTIMTSIRTDASGYARLPFTPPANARPGVANVIARVPGVVIPATFSVTFLPSSTTLTLSGFSPPTGPTTGGTTVILHGTNFVVGSTGVSFGNALSTSVTVTSTTTLSGTAPAHVAGTVDIAVTVGNQTATMHGYTYLDTASIAPQPQPTAHPLPGSGGTAPMLQPARHDTPDGNGGSGSGSGGVQLQTAGGVTATSQTQPARR